LTRLSMTARLWSSVQRWSPMPTPARCTTSKTPSPSSISVRGLSVLLVEQYVAFALHWPTLTSCSMPVRWWPAADVRWPTTYRCGVRVGRCRQARMSSCAYACHTRAVPKTIQIRDLDDDVYAALRRRAVEAGLTVPELLRREATRLASRPTVQEWLSRTRRRPSAIESADVVAALDELRGPWPSARR